MVSNYFAGASGAVVINADVVVVVIVMVCVGSGGRMAGVLAVARLIGLTLAGAGRRTSGRDRTAVAVHNLASAAAATAGSGSSVATVTHDVRRVRRWWMVMVGGGPGGSPGDREP